MSLMRINQVIMLDVITGPIYWQQELNLWDYNKHYSLTGFFVLGDISIY